MNERCILFIINYKLVIIIPQRIEFFENFVIVYPLYSQDYTPAVCILCIVCEKLNVM